MAADHRRRGRDRRHRRGRGSRPPGPRAGAGSSTRARRAPTRAAATGAPTASTTTATATSTTGAATTSSRRDPDVALGHPQRATAPRSPACWARPPTTEAGIAGVAPGAAILPIRIADNILHQSGRLAEAIVYAADRGAGVMSMSLGTDSNSARALPRRPLRHRPRLGARGGVGQRVPLPPQPAGRARPDDHRRRAQPGHRQRHRAERLAGPGRHGLQGARRLLRLRPAPRRGGAHPGAHHRVRRRLHH